MDIPATKRRNQLAHNMPKLFLQCFILGSTNPPSNQAIIYLTRQIANFLRGGPD